MSTAYIVIIAIFLVLTIIGIIFIGLYSRIIFRKKKVEDKLDVINKDLEERGTIIQKVNAIISTQSFHEDNLVLELSNLYENISKKGDSTLNLLNKSEDSLIQALSLDSVHPELSKNNEYVKLKELFRENQYKVMYAIEIYNEEVEEYNNYRKKFIINIVNKICKFTNYDSYNKK
ncbi:MAG: LemA family protein [Bacilli bacterium]|nr:LemA family protein [Bacilli bacterium]